MSKLAVTKHDGPLAPRAQHTWQTLDLVADSAIPRKDLHCPSILTPSDSGFRCPGQQSQWGVGGQLRQQDSPWQGCREQGGRGVQGLN